MCRLDVSLKTHVVLSMWCVVRAINTCCGTLPLLSILVRSPPTFPPYLTNIGLYFPPSSFRYSYAPPTITSLSPGTGPTSGFGADGQPILVTIRGSNFGKVNMLYIIYVIMVNMIGYVIWFTNTFGSYFGKTGSTAREVRITPPVKILPSPAGTSGGRRRMAATAGAGAGGAAAGGSTVRQRFIIHSV